MRASREEGMRKLIGILAGMTVAAFCFAEMARQESWTQALKSHRDVSSTSRECFDKALLSASPQEQIEWYSKAVLKDSKFLEAFVNRGIARGKNAELPEAILDFESAMAIDAEDPLPYVNRAYALLLQQNFDAALADYDKAVALDSKNAVIHNSRAYALYLKGDFTAALKDYDQAIALNPKEAYFYCNRGTLKKQLGNEAGAKADLERASQRPPVTHA